MHELINFLSQPLAMNLASARALVHAMVEHAERNTTVQPDETREPFLVCGSDRVPVESMESISSGTSLTAVVPLSGALSMHGGWFSTSTKAFSGLLQKFDANPRVANIVIPVDSPGGTVTGTVEAANALREIRDAGNTHTVAVVEPMMASAATWIGTAAKEVTVTPSGEAGSIGVISMYQDWSQVFEKMGITLDITRTPAKKARFTGVEPMTDEMRETMEQRNTEAYAEFVEAMAQNRGVGSNVVQSDFGQGEMLSSSEAVSAGLVDRVATLDDVLGEIAAKSAAKSSMSRRRSAAARLRLVEEV